MFPRPGGASKAGDLRNVPSNGRGSEGAQIHGGVQNSLGLGLQTRGIDVLDHLAHDPVPSEL